MSDTPYVQRYAVYHSRSSRPSPSLFPDGYDHIGTVETISAKRAFEVTAMPRWIEMLCAIEVIQARPRTSEPGDIVVDETGAVFVYEVFATRLQSLIGSYGMRQ